MNTTTTTTTTTNAQFPWRIEWRMTNRWVGDEESCFATREDAFRAMDLIRASGTPRAARMRVVNVNEGAAV
jgi:hypothetical protein